MNDPIDPAIAVARDVIFGQVVGDYFDHPHPIALDEAEELARAALEAAAPLIAAKALRDFADAMERDDWTHRDDWGVNCAYSFEARTHADQIEAGQS